MTRNLRRTIDLVASGRKDLFDCQDYEERQQSVHRGTWDGKLLQYIAEQTKIDAEEFLREEESLVFATLGHVHSPGENECPRSKFAFHLHQRAANTAVRWFFLGYWMSQQAEELNLEHTPENAEKLLATEGLPHLVNTLAEECLQKDRFLQPFFFRSVQNTAKNAISLLIKKHSAPESWRTPEAVAVFVKMTMGANGADNFDLGCRVWSAVSDEQKLANL